MLNQKSYFFQYSKSSDSRCHGCNEYIQQDELRVYRNDHFEIYPYPTNGWFHLKCFWLLEEVKNLHANDIMLEIDCRERNYETEFWQYQKHKIVKNNTQLSLHDGQNSCFYTSLAFYDATNAKILLAINEEDLMGIRKKLAEIVAAAVVKDSLNASSTSSSSGYISADDLSSIDEKEKQQLSNTSTSSSDNDDLQLSNTTTTTSASSTEEKEMPKLAKKDMKLDYQINEVSPGPMLD